MVNVFGDSIASGPGNLLARLKTMMMKYSKAMSLNLHLIDYTRIQMVHLSPPFVIMMGGYMYWTMLLQWRLAIEALQWIQ